MRPWTAVPRPLLYLLAVLFCAATTLYACVWMYRIDDPMAWLLAALFTCFIAAPSFHNLQLYSRPLQEFLKVFQSLFYGFVSGLFYLFFAVFPERSKLDRWAPWLKWVALAFCLSQAIPGLAAGNPRWPVWVNQHLGLNNADRVRRLVALTFIVMGMVSLIWNTLSKETSPESRCKSQVSARRHDIGVLPCILERVHRRAHSYHGGITMEDVTLLSVMLLLHPALVWLSPWSSIAYWTIPVLFLRRSARYVPSSSAASPYFAVRCFRGGFPFSTSVPGVQRAFPGGHGSQRLLRRCSIWASGPVVKRGTERIDRAFFRSLLRRAPHPPGSRGQDALRHRSSRTRCSAGAPPHRGSPSPTLGLLFPALTMTSSSPPANRPVPSLKTRHALPANSRFLVELAARGRAWDVPPPGSHRCAGRISPLRPSFSRMSRAPGRHSSCRSPRSRPAPFGRALLQ